MTEAETSRPFLEKNHVHELKCHPDPFDAIDNGRKTCELRRDDRGYMVGHRLLLREFESETGYSGRWLFVTVEHIIRAWDWPGMAGGYVVMSIKPGRFEGEPPFDQMPARKNNWDAFREACTRALDLDVRNDDDILAAIFELRANGAEDARQLQEARTVRDDLGEQLRQTTAAMRGLQVERDEARAALELAREDYVMTLTRARALLTDAKL